MKMNDTRVSDIRRSHMSELAHFPLDVSSIYKVNHNNSMLFSTTCQCIFPKYSIFFYSRRYGEAPLEEFKVLLLGSPNVGKTSLFSKFFSNGDHQHHQYQHHHHLHSNHNYHHKHCITIIDTTPINVALIFVFARS